MSPFHPIAGIKIGTACAQIKHSDRDDLAVFALVEGSTCAAVFTQNAFCAAPITLARQHLAATAPRFLLVNSGNANAGTGPAGLQAAQACCQRVAQLGNCAPTEVLPFSTGIIGQALPVHKIQTALPTALDNLDAQNWEKAARAIMTTDTVPKMASIPVFIDGQPVLTVTGITKGAGMIKPNMATMLAFIATDAAVTAPVLQTCLTRAVNTSFNRITIDGDTSTNDACVLVATGQSHLPVIDSVTHRYFGQLLIAVRHVCEELAKAIVRDGEGATKFIKVMVEQGSSEQECLEIAYAIANSPLVKTACFANDPNWGRILAAVGRAPVENFDISTVQIFLGDVCVVENGEVSANYTEEQGQRVMHAKDIQIRVLLGRGDEHARIWTCDFSYDYVKINAEYRT